MPREMKPIGDGRLNALKGMMGGAPEAEAPAPGGDGYAEADIPGMIDVLENDVLPGASPEKRQHLENAIKSLKACVEEKEAEAPMEEPAPDSEIPAA